jgi:hypothetical protein
MKYLIRSALALALLALAFPVIAKGPLDVYMRYAGYGYDTTIEFYEDDLPVNLTQARGKGTFGSSTIAITVEFVIDPEMSSYCPQGYPIPAAVLDVPDHEWAFVVTAADHSQVIGKFDWGWICLTGDMKNWVGETQGEYDGGTGRYEGASGSFVSHFWGTNLDPSIGLRSITGDVIGTLYLD